MIAEKIKQIFDNNRSWVEDRLKLDKDYFAKLSEGQSPEILYIGCSDSRVMAEELMGVQPGEAFIHRNIANMVPNTDLSTMAVGPTRMRMGRALMGVLGEAMAVCVERMLMRHICLSHCNRTL